MRKFGYVCVGSALLALASAPALAEGFASAKVAARVADFVLIDNVPISDTDPEYAGGWQDIFDIQLKSSNGKYAYIEPSLECILVTETLVKSKNHGKDSGDVTSDTSSAVSAVQVRVLVDGYPAYPMGDLEDPDDALSGTGVTFCKREQEVEATFGGIFVDCDAGDDGITDVLTECNLIDEELRLLLNSTTATSFNFVYGPMDSDVHDVKVQARIVLSADAEAGNAHAEAGIGRGTIAVSEGRLSHSQGDLLCTKEGGGC